MVTHLFARQPNDASYFLAIVAPKTLHVTKRAALPTNVRVVHCPGIPRMMLTMPSSRHCCLLPLLPPLHATPKDSILRGSRPTAPPQKARQPTGYPSPPIMADSATSASAAPTGHTSHHQTAAGRQHRTLNGREDTDRGCTRTPYNTLSPLQQRVPHDGGLFVWAFTPNELEACTVSHRRSGNSRRGAPPSGGRVEPTRTGGGAGHPSSKTPDDGAALRRDCCTGVGGGKPSRVSLVC